MLDLKYVGMMLWILLAHLVVTACGSSGAADFERALCTAEACYTLHVNKVNFDKAHASCVDNGGYLMTVTDRQEERVLESLLPLVGRRREKSVPFWIGLRLRRGQCVLPERTLKGFEWLSSTTDGGQYSNWAADPISTCTEERCAQIRYFPSGQNQLKWVDGQCRRLAFYACKFYFKGMCKPLVLMGPGQINYTAPFSSKPLRTDMRSLPLGTYADVSCGDGQVDFSVCRAVDDSYGWTSAGPFCAASGKKNCAFNNGGCEHLCLEAADGALCACKDGYELSQDQASCSPTDYCRQAACQHQCVMGDSGFTCTCPAGFQLDANLQTCSDMDECQTRVCEDHACVNAPGTYTCDCKAGYQMVAGKCQDVDECSEWRCDQKCLNSLGSFSCHCDVGFVASEDGRSCVDVDECLSGGCGASELIRCTNTVGSFTCACPENYHLDSDGISCDLFRTDAGATTLSNEPVEMLRTAEPPTSIPTVQNLNPNQTFPTDVPVLHPVSTSVADPPNNVSFGRNVRVSKPFNSRMLICIVGSVVPLLLLVMVTVAIVIFRCSRPQREVKKTVTTDGYCWVSSGFEPHLEKLYESVLTDDPPESPLESEA